MISFTLPFFITTTNVPHLDSSDGKTSTTLVRAWSLGTTAPLTLPPGAGRGGHRGGMHAKPEGSQVQVLLTLPQGLSAVLGAEAHLLQALQGWVWQPSNTVCTAAHCGEGASPGYRPWVTGHGPLVTGHRSQAMGHRPLVTGKHTRTQLLSSFHSAQGSHFFVVDFVVTGIIFYCILLYFYCVKVITILNSMREAQV